MSDLSDIECELEIAESEGTLSSDSIGFVSYLIPVSLKLFPTQEELINSG